MSPEDLVPNAKTLWLFREQLARHGLIGIARNDGLTAQAQPFLVRAERAFQTTGRKQRRFHVMFYAAHNWDRRRRIILKAERTAKGGNPRYLMTQLKAESQYLCDRLYCAPW